MRKVDFEVQRVEGLRRTRSLSDGGRIGFWAGLPQAVSKKLRPSQKTTQSRMGTVQGVRVSCELRFTKGAYTKRERVCQLREKGTPTLLSRAGVPFSLKARLGEIIAAGYPASNLRTYTQKGTACGWGWYTLVGSPRNPIRPQRGVG